jgi:hypothetical protein
VRLGEQLGVSVRTAARRHAAAEEAILRQQRIGKHNLIVMGVSRRTGSNLFFGSVPAAVLERSACLFVSSQVPGTPGRPARRAWQASRLPPDNQGGGKR